MVILACGPPINPPQLVGPQRELHVHNLAEHEANTGSDRPPQLHNAPETDRPIDETRDATGATDRHIRSSQVQMQV